MSLQVESARDFVSQNSELRIIPENRNGRICNIKISFALKVVKIVGLRVKAIGNVSQIHKSKRELESRKGAHYTVKRDLSAN